MVEKNGRVVFNFGDPTIVAFFFRDSYTKIETTLESVYTPKRLSNYLNKLVKFLKNKFLLKSFQE